MSLDNNSDNDIIDNCPISNGMDETNNLNGIEENNGRFDVTLNRDNINTWKLMKT